MRYKVHLSAAFVLLFYVHSSIAQTSAPLKREFRGVWVATVANIDWPSKPGLSSDIQKRELIEILDNHQKSGINALMLQIRPATDALYAKSRELWSRFLTGKQGKAPEPFYDPLEFAVKEAHKRGMELHAWFNPYRATFDMIAANTDVNHITRQKPEWFFTYGGKKLFNPGIPEVQQYIVQVILDVVRNYDIDGVHFDDYFYPYQEPGQKIRDEETYNQYGSGFSSVEDWRRHNVDTLIHTLYDSIHAAKKYVKFGISPFGIWKNKSQDSIFGSESYGGSSYVELYADSKKWVKEGWVDYINPQLYWPLYFRAAPFEKLVDWWSMNSFNRNLYIGQGAYRAEEKRPGWNDRRQIPDQIRYLRSNPRVQGSVYFSSKSLTRDLGGVNDSLRYDFYKYPALQPQMLWIDNVDPNPPRQLIAKVNGNSAQLTWLAPTVAKDGDTAYGYVIYRFNEGEDVSIEDPKNILKISFDNTNCSYFDTNLIPGSRYTYVVTAIDRLKNESVMSNIAGTIAKK